MLLVFVFVYTAVSEVPTGPLDVKSFSRQVGELRYSDFDDFQTLQVIVDEAHIRHSETSIAVVNEALFNLRLCYSILARVDRWPNFKPSFSEVLPMHLVGTVCRPFVGRYKEWFSDFPSALLHAGESVALSFSDSKSLLNVKLERYLEVSEDKAAVRECASRMEEILTECFSPYSADKKMQMELCMPAIAKFTYAYNQILSFQEKVHVPKPWTCEKAQLWHRVKVYSQEFKKSFSNWDKQLERTQFVLSHLCTEEVKAELPDFFMRQVYKAWTSFVNMLAMAVENAFTPEVQYALERYAIDFRLALAVVIDVTKPEHEIADKNAIDLDMLCADDALTGFNPCAKYSQIAAKLEKYKVIKDEAFVAYRKALERKMFLAETRLQKLVDHLGRGNIVNTIKEFQPRVEQPPQESTTQLAWIAHAMFSMISTGTAIMVIFVVSKTLWS